MTTATHGSQQLADGLHGILALGPYANEAARIGASGLASTQIGQVALQTDTGAGWLLTNNSPVVWAHVFGPPPIHTEPTTSRTVSLTDGGAYIRCTNASATSITIPLNATVAFAVGTVILVGQQGSGQVTLVGVGGVTLNTRSSLLTKAIHSILAVQYVGADIWDVSGDEQ
jgi:hypothetical protein